MPSPTMTSPLSTFRRGSPSSTRSTPRFTGFRARTSAIPRPRKRPPRPWRSSRRHSRSLFRSCRTARLTVLATTVFFLAGAAPVRAQGGPPLLTDDPGTPGAGRWEVNVAFTLDRTSAGREIGAPLVDANYGWGERVQLKLEMPWVVVSDDLGTRSGIGNPLLGVKWRFLDEDNAGVAVSTYPQLGFNLVSASADRGLVERETSFLLPVSAVKRIGPVSLDVEADRKSTRLD